MHLDQMRKCLAARESVLGPDVDNEHAALEGLHCLIQCFFFNNFEFDLRGLERRALNCGRRVGTVCGSAAFVGIPGRAASG